MAFEVVDGQQRLRAILDFYTGNLTLSKSHNSELGGSTFLTLPDPVRRSFLDYEISTEVMEKAEDEEVWAMFERLNTYTLTLNKQERLNSKWFGRFKQTAYKLAAEESALEAWKQLRVFSDQQIARMKEVELTSDVLVAIVRGMSDITDIPGAYKDFDMQFPQAAEASQQFRSTLSWIVNELPDSVRDTRFRRKAWFYSLLVATADALSGIPQGKGPRPLRDKSQISARMYELDSTLRKTELPRGLAKLRGALSRATSHIPERQVRHDFFFGMVTSGDTDWKKMRKGRRTKH
jgi:hypothetical protein